MINEGFGNEAIDNNNKKVAVVVKLDISLDYNVS